jgi:hypothetical protein
MQSPEYPALHDVHITQNRARAQRFHMDLFDLSRDGSVEALFLDDCRTPAPSAHFKWVIVRTHVEFCRFIRQRGLPAFISFDHDLGEEAIRIGADADWKEFDYSLATEPTGYDSAKWLMDYCLDNDMGMPPFTVHSANPAGAANILGLLNNLRRHQGLPPDGYRTAW